MPNQSATIIPSIGRTVHFVLANGQHRPAIIVRVFGEPPTPTSVANLQIFRDGSNDVPSRAPGEGDMLWRTSVHQDAETMQPGTWHSPEVVTAVEPTAV
jgi:hypothetical protein